MKDLINYIICALVDNADNVSVDEKVDANAVVITVKVPGDQIGKVIGKNGRIATSIRNIVRSISAKEKKKYIVKIGENWCNKFPLAKL